MQPGGYRDALILWWFGSDNLRYDRCLGCDYVVNLPKVLTRIVLIKALVLMVMRRVMLKVTCFKSSLPRNKC